MILPALGKRFIRLSILTTTMTVILLLTACAPAPQKPVTVENPKTVWVQHQQQAAELSSWDILGKLGIRTPEQSNSASINWQQSDRVFNIQVTSLLGQSVATLAGTTDNTYIKLAGHGEYNSRNPEQLLLKELGWTLPIKALNYWVRGIPAPDHPASYQLNEQGLLDTLQQSGWQLSFSRYEIVDSHTLPSKVRLQQNDVIVTLLIKRWSITTPVNL